MEQVTGHKIDVLPISKLMKVNDLLEYEGPILSHFVDERNSNYLFYWVDFDNSFNRWLVWKITELQLYKYLRGAATLKEIMEEPNKDFIYSVEIDNQLNYRNVYAIDLADIPDAYRPEETSNFKFEVPPAYQDLINHFEQNSYVAYLRELALYFTLEPSENRFSTTVAAIDAGNFLRKFTSSFLGFVEEDFYAAFKNIISDFEKLKKTIQQFKTELSPRVVDMEYSSFKVGISSDILTKVDSDRYNDWQRIILQKYKQEVVDIDYNDDEVLRSIAAKYNEEARKKIYGPYIEILNDPDYKLKVNNYDRSFVKTYAKISKAKEAIIIPRKEKAEPESEKMKLFSVILEIHEGEDLTKISKKALQSGLLFSQELEKAPIILNEINTTSTKLILNHPIQYLLSIENNRYKAESLEFAISIESVSKETLFERFQQRFVENFFNLENDTSPESQSLRSIYRATVKERISTQ